MLSEEDEVAARDAFSNSAWPTTRSKNKEMMTGGRGTCTPRVGGCARPSMASSL